MRVTLRNDFHNTEINVNVTDPKGYLSVAQTRRVKDALCGITDCCCGDVRGPQGDDGLVEVTRERLANGNDVYQVVVHLEK
jgi:hypothetical protein